MSLNESISLQIVPQYQPSLPLIFHITPSFYNYYMAQPESKYVPSQYTRLSNVYNQHEFVSVQKLLRNIAFGCLYNARYPILKLLKAICRRLLINEFEAIFFAFVVQTNRWNIHDDVIKRCHAQVRDIVCYATDNPEYKSLTLYLLLCGYTVKYYLNEDIEMYTSEMNRVCPDFRGIFETWAKQYAQTTLKINPKNLNKVYKEVFLTKEDADIQEDYNSLVDNLLQISPAYNPEKDKDKDRDREKDKESHPVKQEPIRQQPQRLSVNHFTNYIPSSSLVNLRILSSSGYLQQISPFGTASAVSSGFGSMNRGITLNASNYGFNHALSDEDCIGDVNIGFRAAESDCEDNRVEGIKEDAIDKDNNNIKLGDSGVSELLFRKNISSFSAGTSGFFK